MKSYLRFLSRNKLYTAIEVVGLSVGLAFLIILGSIIIDKSQVNDNIKDADEIYTLVYTEYGASVGHDYAVGSLLPQIPQVKEWTVFSSGRGLPLHTEKGESVIAAPMNVASDFFTFFGLDLVAGDPETALKSKDAAVISRNLAEVLYKDENPVGQTITLEQEEIVRGRAFLVMDSPITTSLHRYTITGIVDDLGKNVLPEADIYFSNLDEMPSSAKYMFRTDSGKNIDAILQTIKNHPVNDEYDKSYFENTEIIRFEDIKDGEIRASGFRHISDPKTFKAFVLICIVILSFSIFNYISLTLAFSRFRLKEAATRALLGTSKRETVLRCIGEAFLLVISSYILAILLVLAFRNEMTSFFNLDIKPLGDAAVFGVTFATAIATALIAGAINTFMNRRYRPIEVIKGESRYQDKAVLGKVFIGIQSSICLAVIITGSAIMLQTKKMTDYPVGFNTENIISVVGSETSFIKHKDDIRSLPFVENTGCVLNDFTINTFPQMLEDNIGWCMLQCDQDAFDILGFKIKRMVESSGESYWKAKKTYTTENSFQLAMNLKHINWSNKFAAVLEDFHLGSLKNIPASSTIFDIMLTDEGEIFMANHMLIKVSGDQKEAEQKIREYFIEKGVYHESMTINTLEEKVRMNYTEELNMLKLVSVFAGICLLLTILAIVVLSSYFAQIKTHDTAVHKVFGMSSGETFMKTVWGFTAPVFVGAFVALPFAWLFVSRWLKNYPFRIENSPVIYIAALVAVLAVTVVSVALQAVRLMRTNPAEVLKKE